MDKQKILLIGAGGHCKVVLDVLLKSGSYQAEGIIDVEERVGQHVLGIPVIGTDGDLPRLFKSGITLCFVTIGSIGDPSLRAAKARQAKDIGFSFPNVISERAIVSAHARLGEGILVAPGAIINAEVQIGHHCIINTGCVVEHDCILGDFVHVAPGAVLSGGTSVGNCTHIGAGCVVIQNLKVGANVMIGAGSVVTKNIPDRVIAYGNPCKEKCT